MHVPGNVGRLLATAGALLLLATALWARLEAWPGTADLTPFTNSYRVFRGTVISVAETRNRSLPWTALAKLKVERWYGGGDGLEVSVRFNSGPVRFPGHDCIDFLAGTHWLIFAKGQNNSLELVDDCYAAVSVSRLMSPILKSGNPGGQLDADLIAGLGDPDPAARLKNIQALGGLKSATSRPALQAMIAHGDENERDWAIYAALRSGDITVLPEVRDMLARGSKNVPEFPLAWELSQLRDRGAIPQLAAIATSASNAEARKYALEALGRNLHALEALPTVASRLEDPEAGVRFYALNALEAITRAPACTLNPGYTEAMIEPQVRLCSSWWNQTGAAQFGHRQ
jgi:hypothetical protein